MSNFFLTYNAKKVYLNDFNTEVIWLDDIAHHLTNINRYCGSLPFNIHYSVAQHSILIADHIYSITQNKIAAALALLHDASEAYLSDINSHLKPLLPDYKKLEKSIQTLIYKKYFLIDENYFSYIDMINSADKAIVLDECFQLMPKDKWKYYLEGNEVNIGLGVKITQQDKEYTKRLFLSKCREYGIEENNKQVA